MAKEVFLDVTWRQHSLFRDLLSYPPDGYQFVTDGALRRAFEFAGRASLAHGLKRQLVDPYVPANLLKSLADKFLERKPREALLTYASQHLVFRPEPWVLEVELVHALAGGALWGFKWYKGLIERTLASGDCKRIIVWTEAGRKTILKALNSSKFANKIETVYIARAPNHDFTKTYYGCRTVKLLFVNSSNIPGQSDIKGGKEVIEAYINLRKKYDNLELVLRSDVPSKVKERIRGVPGLRVIDQLIPWESLEQQFKTADIYLFPSDITPGMSILDAMSYELPVVTIDAYANAELVEDGKTGFVVKKSSRIPYDEFYFQLNHRRQFLKAIKNVDREVVQRLVEKVSILIENPQLRQRMGEAGRYEVERGKFSIQRRNEKLKRIFDEATS